MEEAEPHTFSYQKPTIPTHGRWATTRATAISRLQHTGYPDWGYMRPPLLLSHTPKALPIRGGHSHHHGLLQDALGHACPTLTLPISMLRFLLEAAGSSSHEVGIGGVPGKAWGTERWGSR